jgi:hypothetical protein
MVVRFEAEWVPWGLLIADLGLLIFMFRARGARADVV